MYLVVAIDDTGHPTGKEIQTCQTENENDDMTATEPGGSGTHVIERAAFSVASA
jgi:hypothetical protein